MEEPIPEDCSTLLDILGNAVTQQLENILAMLAR